MRRIHLKLLRRVAAAVVFVGLTAALIDFRSAVPWIVGHELASIQLVPSLVALITGVSLSLAAIVMMAVTLAVGRVYCSVICPLGILQDVVARLAAWLRRGKSPFSRYARPWTWLRQIVLWGTVAGVVAGGSGLTLALLDPYSNYGRIAADLFRPVATLANNSVVGVAHALGFAGLYWVAPQWVGLGALHQPALLLLLLVVLVAWRGRLYCNTLCPVGTFLGLLARRAAFRLAIDKSACTKCVACLNVCKSQCIDLRTTTIDFSRCVACYNCIDACERQGIAYRFAWRRSGASRRTTVPSPAGPAATAVATDPDRRAFLAGAATALAVSLGAGLTLPARGQPGPNRPGPAKDGHPPDHDADAPAICPPGAGSIDRFLDRCTSCHLCVSACPTHVLTPAWLEYGFAGLMKPRLDYSAAFCNFECRRCAEVCPDGALTLLALADKQLTQIGEAHFAREKCIVVVKGTDCAACSEHCPTKAVYTVPYGGNLRLPKVNDTLCIGCGACEFACPVQPVKAIVVTGRRRHGRAQKSVEPKAAAPVPAGDFPF